MRGPSLTLRCLQALLTLQYVLDRPGTILRFTALQDLEEGALRAAGRPLPPPSANVSKNFVQGHLLEVRDGELIVSFDEKKAWPIGDEEYRSVRPTAACENAFSQKLTTS